MSDCQLASRCRCCSDFVVVTAVSDQKHKRLDKPLKELHLFLLDARHIQTDALSTFINPDQLLCE